MMQPMSCSLGPMLNAISTSSVHVANETLRHHQRKQGSDTTIQGMPTASLVANSRAEKLVVAAPRSLLRRTLLVRYFFAAAAAFFASASCSSFSMRFCFITAAAVPASFPNHSSNLLATIPPLSSRAFAIIVSRPV